MSSYWFWVTEPFVDKEKVVDIRQKNMLLKKFLLSCHFTSARDIEFLLCKHS